MPAAAVTRQTDTNAPASPIPLAHAPVAPTPAADAAQRHLARAAARAGYAVSILLHGSIVALMVWGLQADSADAFAEDTPLTVQLSMFAPPMPVPMPPVPANAETAQTGPDADVLPEPSTQEAPDPPEVLKQEPPDPPPELAVDHPLPERTPAPVKQVAESRKEIKRPEPAKPEPKVSSSDRSAAAAKNPSEVDSKTATAPPAAAPPLSSPPGNLRDAYRIALLEAIERNKFYPKRALLQHVEGEVKVRFKIVADGRLMDIRLFASSGSRVLDDAAIAALQRLGRVEPIPSELGMSEWNLVVPLVFSLLRPL